VDSKKTYIIHNSADKHLARRLAFDLRMAGVDAWFDEWEIRVGHSIVDKMHEGIYASAAFVVLISRASSNAYWVKREVDAAFKRVQADQAVILPVRVDDSDVPPLLSGYRWTDLRNYELALMELLDGLLERDRRPPLLGRGTSRIRRRAAFQFSDDAERLALWLHDKSAPGYDFSATYFGITM
jgi:hypothetical protein